MIQLSFQTGSGIRKIIIRERKVIIISAETNFVPFIVNLDKLDDDLIKSSKYDINDLKKIKGMKNEKEMAEDITEEFRKKGWRLIRKG